MTAEKDQLIVRCLSCGTKNRIPKEHMQDRPTCGKCRSPLDDMIIRCLSCGTKNRMPETRLNDRPLCGRCGDPLIVGGDAGKPFDTTDATFSREILAVTGTVIVDCWAPWCAPCRLVAPVLDELAAKYAGGIKIAKLNVDENPVTAAQYDIRNIPTLLFFREGKLVNRVTGASPKEEIERHLLAVMKTN
jgi:thioredoxin 2